MRPSYLLSEAENSWHDARQRGLKQNKARYRAIKPTDDDDDIGLIGKLANITMPCYKCVPSPIFNLKLSHSAFIPAVSASQQRKRPRWSLRTKVYITIPVDQVVAPHVTSCHCKNSFRDSGRQAEVEEGGTTSSKTTKAESWESGEWRYSICKQLEWLCLVLINVVSTCR